MAARALVESDIDEGVRLLNALDEAGLLIEVAYWMLSPEWGDWWLVLGTSLYDQHLTPSAMQQVVDVRRSLEDTDFLMGKLGVVPLYHRWVRALRQRLSRGLPHPGYRLGHFYAADLEVEDSYVYRLLTSPDTMNGPRARRRMSSNGIGMHLKAPVISRLKSEVRAMLGAAGATPERGPGFSG